MRWSESQLSGGAAASHGGRAEEIATYLHAPPRGGGREAERRSSAEKATRCDGATATVNGSAPTAAGTIEGVGGMAKKDWV